MNILTFLITLLLIDESKATTYYNTNSKNNNYDSKTHISTLSKIAPLLGESAIVDKESSQVFWQGGEQSLFHSTVGHVYLSNQENGILHHIRSTILSCVLWMAFVKKVVECMLRQHWFSRTVQLLDTSSQKITSSSSLLQKLQLNDKIRIFVKNIARVLRHVARFCLIILSFLPNFHRIVIITCTCLYLVESYTCSTRKYLDNALSSPIELEKYLQMLKNEKPIVKWEIRCFHYEKKRWLCALLLWDFWNWFFSIFKGETRDADSGNDQEPLGSSLVTRKVISHHKTKQYTYESCDDQTLSGIWKQATATTSLIAPFTKISLSKVLLFADGKTRKDYFSQQTNFVRDECQLDEYAEFSTSIEVKGFRPKLLAINEVQGGRLSSKYNLFRIHSFWIFTLLGLTVPYRIWFSRHCDELRVTLIKETSATVRTKPTTSQTSMKSWFNFQSIFGSSKEQNVGDLRNDIKEREEFYERVKELVDTDDKKNIDEDHLIEDDSETSNDEDENESISHAHSDSETASNEVDNNKMDRDEDSL